MLKIFDLILVAVFFLLAIYNAQLSDPIGSYKQPKWMKVIFVLCIPIYLYYAYFEFSAKAHTAKGEILALATHGLLVIQICLILWNKLDLTRRARPPHSNAQ